MKTFLFIFLAGCAVRCDDSNYYVVQMPERAPTKDFKVYWNVPTMQCKSKKISFDDLYEKFGILQNTGDSFRGDRISILYDPGDFPALLRNSTSGEIKYRNGGVPQEGDLIKHLDTYQSVLEQSVPDRNFNGVGIIDFESWKPVLRQNFGILTPYKDVSYEIEKKRHWWWKKQWIEEEAKRRFEQAGREFMQATIALSKKMRPQALWGYYGFPYCFNMAYNNRKEACADKVPQENDGINWLWKESTALYPSVYSTDDMTPGQLAGLIRGRVKEAARVALRGTPILPYFWYRYRDKDFFNESDLHVAFSTFYKSNASGFIIWGSSNDVNTVDKCNKLREYVTNVLGPAVAKYTKPQIRLEDEPDEAYNVVYNPNNHSKYDPEYTWIPPVNYTQNIEQMVDQELKEEKEKETTGLDEEKNESILVDMILHKIANYCVDGCDNNKVRTEALSKNGTSEAAVLLVTEDPFKKDTSNIDVMVSSTTEDKLIYNDDVYDTSEYSDNKTTQETSTISTSTEDSSTPDKSPEDSSTIIISTPEANNSTSTDQTSTVITSTVNNNLVESNVVDISTTPSNTNGYINTESTTSISTENTSTVDSIITESSTISTTEPASFSTEESSTIYLRLKEESTTVGANGTNGEGTTLAPVLTEQVVVSVV